MQTTHLIKNIDDFQKFVRINQSVLQESFLPYEYDAREKYLLPYIGNNLHEQLLKIYNQQVYPDWADTDEKKQTADKILYYCQNALAKFTLFLAAPHMDLHLSEMGFVVTHTANSAPASAHRVQAATDAFLSQGYDNLETLLRFLEINRSQVTSYSDTQAYVFEFSNLINTATEFNQILFINASRLRFIQLKPEMQNIKHLTIIPSISKELFDHIVTNKKDNNLTDAEKKLLVLLQKSMAYLSMSETLSEENILSVLNPLSQSKDTANITQNTLVSTKTRLKDYGLVYLAQAKKLLNKEIEKFPLYQASSLYVEEQTHSPYENNDEDKIFIFGQPSLD